MTTILDSESNWLPSAFREVFLLKNDPTSGRAIPTAVQLGSFGTGGPIESVILQDFSLELARVYSDRGIAEIYFTTLLENPVNPLLRYGYKHLGYLQDVPVLAGAHLNKGIVVPEGCWNFVRPYRIFPGETMRGLYRSWAGNIPQNYPRRPAMVFNGVRVADEQPIQMYSSANRVDDTNPLDLSQAGFTCPADSPVDLYGVSAFGLTEIAWPLGGGWQIRGPDEREWRKTRFIRTERLNGILPLLPASTQVQLESARWISPYGAHVKLGEERGWTMERDETFIAEVTGPDISEEDLSTDFWLGILTLRASSEVTYG
jgi:hypothetical protein